MKVTQIILQKLSSRKFITAIAGIASGLLLISNGSREEGTAVICTSVVAYLAAEGYIDSKAINNCIEKEEDINDNE